MKKPTIRLLRVGHRNPGAVRSLLLAAGLSGTVSGGVACGVALDANVDPIDDGMLSNEVQAPRGTLELRYVGVEGYRFQSLNGVEDAFTYARQRITLRVPAWFLWEQLYPELGVPEDEVLKRLRVSAVAHFQDQASWLAPQQAAFGKWVAENELSAELKTFRIPAKTDRLGFTLVITDPSNNKTVTLGAEPNLLGGPAVFAGDLPNKTLFLDTWQNELRERVIERGFAVRESFLTVGYSDWRADQLVNRIGLDTKIGEARFDGRFGPSFGPIYGQIAYEVSIGHRFDTGDWQAERLMRQESNSRLHPFKGRIAYEDVLPVPAEASALETYYRVKAYVVADYTGYNVVTAYYAQGQHVLKADQYDNPNGPGTNYTTPVE